MHRHVCGKWPKDICLPEIPLSYISETRSKNYFLLLEKDSWVTEKIYNVAVVNTSHVSVYLG